MVVGKIKIFMPVNKVKMRFFKFDDAWSSGWNETDCMIAKDRSCLEVSVERKKKEKNVWTHRRFFTRFCLEKTKWPLTIFYIIKMFRSSKKNKTKWLDTRRLHKVFPQIRHMVTFFRAFHSKAKCNIWGNTVSIFYVIFCWSTVNSKLVVHLK